MRIHYASECLLELISKERICFDRRDVCKMQVDGNVWVFLCSAVLAWKGQENHSRKAIAVSLPFSMRSESVMFPISFLLSHLLKQLLCNFRYPAYWTNKDIFLGACGPRKWYTEFRAFEHDMQRKVENVCHLCNLHGVGLWFSTQSGTLAFWTWWRDLGCNMIWNPFAQCPNHTAKRMFSIRKVAHPSFLICMQAWVAQRWLGHQNVRRSSTWTSMSIAARLIGFEYYTQ